jgi:hypothetical protein
MIYKAITLYQPWASALFTLRDHPAHPADFIKTVETRSWGNWYAGDLAIHAGKEFGKNKEEKEYACELARLWGFDPVLLPRSAVLGIVRITAAGKFPHPEMPEEEYRGCATGDFSPGRFGSKLKVMEIFSTPISARGNRLLWNWIRS